MQTSGWIQFALYVVALALITKPMGLYLMRVLDANGKTWLDPVLQPLERLTYRVMGVDPEQGTRLEAIHAGHAAVQPGGLLFTYAILRLQHLLPLNPQGLRPAGPAPRVQHRRQLHDEHQLAELRRRIAPCPISRRWSALTFHNFVSAAAGIAIAAALVRGIARHSAKTLGNFWVDLVRVTYYLLLPICLVFAVFLVSQGMIQNFKPYTKAKLVEPMKISGRAKKNDEGKPVHGR